VKVGLSYDLRDDYLREGYGEEETAEFDRQDTIDAIAGALAELGYEPCPIGHVRALMTKLAAGERWDVVFNIAEGLYGLGREALVPALLDAYRVPYVFSDPAVLGLALHKGLCKHVVRDLGVPTAPFVVVTRADELRRIELPYPLFAKPVAEGTGKGISAASLLAGPADLERFVPTLLERFAQPVLVETYLPGREFTVGIVGTGTEARVLATMEVVLAGSAEAGSYTYENKEHYEDRVHYRRPEAPIEQAAAAVALEAWRGLGCRDGGRVDLRADAAGVPNFVEVNPLAGLHPVRSDLPIACSLVGIRYRELIDAIMRSALGRIGLPPPRD
jgi:D-alanine-D-alanine ligase